MSPLYTVLFLCYTWSKSLMFGYKFNRQYSPRKLPSQPPWIYSLMVASVQHPSWEMYMGADAVVSPFSNSILLFTSSVYQLCCIWVYFYLYSCLINLWSSLEMPRNIYFGCFCILFYLIAYLFIFCSFFFIVGLWMAVDFLSDSFVIILS